jgi:hypothetical protein
MGRYVKISSGQAEPAASYGNSATMLGVGVFEPIRVKSISNPVDRGLMQEENIEGYIPTAAYGGALKVSGTLEGNLRPKQMKMLIYSLMGASANLTGSDPIVSGTKFTMSNPSSFQMKIGEQTSAATTDLELGYMGACVKTFNMNIAAKEFVTARFDWFAKNYTAASVYSPPTSGDYTTEQPIVFYNATVTIGGTDMSSKIKSLTINIDRKVDEERFVIGDYTLQEIGINGMNEVTGDITFTEKEYGQFRNTLFGATTGANMLGCDNAVGGASFLAMFTNIAACGAEVGKMYIKFTQIVLGSTDTTINGQNEIEKKVSYRAVGDFEMGVAS